MTKEAPIVQLELVHPLYLDTPLMIGFLAALEGGVAFDADVTRKGRESSDVAGEVEDESKISGWLSTLIQPERTVRALEELRSAITQVPRNNRVYELRCSWSRKTIKRRSRTWSASIKWCNSSLE